MKIWIGYPPLPDPKGVPLISQNRQFQWFNDPTFIYPVIPTMAATVLKQAGHDVLWEDGVAQRDSVEAYEKRFVDAVPEVVAFEVKTPVVKRVWKVIDRMKSLRPETKFVLMGDHITAMPEESLIECNVDYCLTGGDFDFSLLNLINHLDRGEQLEPGVYFWRDAAAQREAQPKFRGRSMEMENWERAQAAREKGKPWVDGMLCTGAFGPLKHDLTKLPMIDRELSKWHLYAYDNGNFKFLPGTYTMVGRDCWWGKCTFCSWTTTFTNFRCQTAQQMLNEVEHLASLGVREIFDDTGTFPAGKWLHEFCTGMVERGLHKKVVMGCNMIPGVLDQDHYDLMGKANFRFVLYGLESANQPTLDRIKKLGRADKLAESMRMAKKAGLEPHVTCMVGYPWESEEEALRTINLTKSLFDKGYIDTLQATVVMPYPGTPLFADCKRNGLLRTENWDEYDMRIPIMKCPMSDKRLMEITQGIYTSFLTPKYILRKLASIRTWDDVKFATRAGMKVLGHLEDFNFLGIGTRQRKKAMERMKQEEHQAAA
jgi:anaerobic magnesium-protoporphyrin IX monomethyl ester cyclase